MPLEGNLLKMYTTNKLIYFIGYVILRNMDTDSVSN